MASAMLQGLHARQQERYALWAYDVDATKTAALQAQGVLTAADSAQALVWQADVLVLAVKPQVLGTVVPPLREALSQKRPLIISIAAGTTLAMLEELAGAAHRIVRVMPNINATVGEAMSAFCGNAAVTDADRDTARDILGACGRVTELPEDRFAVYSALAGCSPAYTLLYIDALAQAGVQGGLTKAQSLEIVAQAVLGTAKLLQAGGHPRELMDRICSPAGTTIAGVAALQDEGFEAAVVHAAQASVRRDNELAAR